MNGVQAAARLDRMPLSSFHRRVMVLIGAGLLIDALEMQIGGAVAAAVLKEGWSTLELNATFGTATFLGLVIGAWSAGIAGDLWGRRFSYQFNLAIFGLASIAAAFAPSMPVLIVIRFIMGIGLGAELVIGYATFAEFVPPRSRGRMVALLSFVVNWSVFISSLAGLYVIPTFGWRYLFVAIGVAALILFLMRKSMPESPRWLESKGRSEEAEQILRRMEEESFGRNAIPPLPAQAQAVSPVEGSSFATLFKSDVLPRTIVACSIMMILGFAINGFITWLPTFFVQQGQSIVRSLTWTTLMTFGGPVGGLIGVLLVDRAGRRKTIAGAALAAATLGFCYQFVTDPNLLLLTGFLIVCALFVIVIVGQAVYVPELFGTSYRMRGVGLAGTAGRLTATGVQFLILWLFGLGGVSLVVGTLSGALLLVAVIVITLGVETSGRSLEAVARQ